MLDAPPPQLLCIRHTNICELGLDLMDGTWRSRVVQSLDELPVQLLQGGSSGPDLLVLHDDWGFDRRLECLSQLQQSFQVTLLLLPGYQGSDHPEWARSVGDLACLVADVARQADLGGAAILGVGLGGWIAAHTAASVGGFGAIRGLVLVGAAGIQPRHAEIRDQFLVSHQEFMRTGFFDQKNFDAAFGSTPSFETLTEWESNRRMTAQIAWSPCMADHTMPARAKAINAPTLVLWGAEDRIVPLECGELYASAIPNARLESIADAGHMVLEEKPFEVAAAVERFLADL
jgi:pimeloyl-ACP methyl ester carboxylesterase